MSVFEILASGAGVYSVTRLQNEDGAFGTVRILAVAWWEGTPNALGCASPRASTGSHQFHVNTFYITVGSKPLGSDLETMLAPRRPR